MRIREQWGLADIKGGGQKEFMDINMSQKIGGLVGIKSILMILGYYGVMGPIATQTSVA